MPAETRSRQYRGQSVRDLSLTPFPVVYAGGCRSAVTLALLIACPTKVYHYYCHPLFLASAAPRTESTRSLSLTLFLSLSFLANGSSLSLLPQPTLYLYLPVLPALPLALLYSPAVCVCSTLVCCRSQSAAARVKVKQRILFDRGKADLDFQLALVVLRPLAVRQLFVLVTILRMHHDNRITRFSRNCFPRLRVGFLFFFFFLSNFTTIRLKNICYCEQSASLNISCFNYESLATSFYVTSLFHPLSKSA